ncbi:MAG: hypothetical protein ACREHD_31675 [Pirellulales bacterium]
MATQAEVNPYQAPGREATPAGDAVEDPRAARRIKLAWVGVFLLNLCVPLLLAWSLTEQGGRLGMFVATAALFVAGYWLCASVRRFGQALVVGGVAVGLAQVAPVLQIWSGMAGYLAAEFLGLERSGPHAGPRLTSEAAGFVTTITTGGLLMAAAFVAGLAIRGLFSNLRKSGPG